MAMFCGFFWWTRSYNWCMAQTGAMQFGGGGGFF